MVELKAHSPDAAPSWGDASRAADVRRAAVIGSLLGGIMVACMLTRASFDFARPQLGGDFFDAQAHALLKGHLDVDAKVLGVEAFDGTGGRSYMYFGPWPAILRLPVAAFTHRFDGRLSALSMLLAYAVSMAALTRAASDVTRRLDRPTEPLGALGARARWVVSGVFAVLGGGASLLYLASVPWVYHEASAWGVAWSLVALVAAVRVFDGPTLGAIAVLGLATTLALWSRVTVALGPVAAAWLAAALSMRLGHRRSVAPACLSAVAPIFAYTAVNHAKFGLWFSIPFWGQIYTKTSAAHRAFLAANNGTLFGLKFAPTVLLAYLRPDGVVLERSFPFVDFREIPGTVVGNVVFETFDYVASIPSTLPLLVVLAALGVAAVVRRAELAPYRLVLPAGAIGALTVIPFGYIAHRYITDAFPALALASVIGIATLDPPDARSARFVALGLVALGAWTAWVNWSLALLYRSVYAPARDPATFTSFARLELAVDRALGVDFPWRIVIGDSPPPQGRRGDLFIVGDCAALYYTDGHEPSNLERVAWSPAERTEQVGFFQLSLDATGLKTWSPNPVLSVDESEGPPDVLGLERLPGNRVRFAYSGRGYSYAGDAVALGPSNRLDVTVDADRRLGILSVTEGTHELFKTFYAATGDGFHVGVASVPGIAERFSGTITRRFVPGAPLCRSLRP